MAVQPNALCLKFCYWMLNVSWQRLTTPRLNTITDVQTAAQNQTTVTDTVWNNFTQITAWRYPYFLVWLDNANQWLSETAAYLAQVTTRPPNSQIAAIDTFINTNKNNGNWATFDAVWLLACNSAQQAWVNMVNPLSTQISLIGAPSFAQNLGYTGNGTTTGLDTNWNPSTAAVNYTLNSGHIGAYIRTNRAAANKCAVGGSTTGPLRLIELYPFDAGSKMTGNINSSGNSAKTNTSSAGWQQAIRTSNVLTTLYRNNVSLGTDATASSAIPNSKLAICGQYINGAFGTDSSNDQIALVIAGGAPADNTGLYNSVNLLASQIGFNV